MKKICFYLVLLVFLIIVLFLPSVGVSGVKLGTNLLLFSLIPALLPFIILSNVIIKLNSSDTIGRIFHPLFRRLFHVSTSGTYAIIMGYLCGYPIGAKVISDLLDNNKISKEESSYLFNFINNPSPVFIQGYLIINILHSPQYRILALILAYTPTLILGVITRNKTEYPSPATQLSKGSTLQVQSVKSSDVSHLLISKLLDDSIINGFVTIAKLGGYLIIFSIFSIGISKLFFIPTYIRTILICIMEITTGTYYISLLNINTLIKVFCCIVASIFGGFSTIFQTKSVSGSHEQNIKKYMLYRIYSITICFVIFAIYLSITSYLYL